MIANELLKGTLRSIILKLLFDNEKLYGYEITQKVNDLSGGKIRLTFGALYPILHRFEADGTVRTETENVDNRIRKYYSLTASGKKEAERKISEFEDYLRTMTRMFHK